MWKEGVRSLIYGNPERQRKIFFERLFSRKKDLKCLNRGQNQYLTAFGIKSLQKQTAGNNCSVCRTGPLNVRLRAAEIRFAQLKEGKPPMLFILKKLIQANSPTAEPGPLGLSKFILQFSPTVVHDTVTVN